MRRTWAGVAVLTLLLCGGCGRFVRHGEVRATATPETASVGRGLLAPTPTPAGGSRSAAPSATAESRSSGRALLTVRLTDVNGHHPAGVPVSVTGPVERTLVSDRRGEVTVSRPGVYRLAVIAGCRPDIEVLSGGRGTAGVAEQAGQRVELAVEWRHRFVPSAPVFADPAGVWTVGTPILLRFDVIDRCGGRERAPGGSISTFAFRPGPNVDVVEPPDPVADEEGHGRMTIRCRRAGAAELRAQDTTNPADEVDLVGAIFAYGARLRCADG